MRESRKRKFLFLLLLLIFYTNGYPDAAGYAEKKLFIKTSEKFTIIHRHDWTKSTRKLRWNMFTKDQNPFTSKNNYANLECVDNRTHNIIFTSPTPALTYLFISDDSRFIIGLSKIKLLNPVQIVLFDTNGNLIFYTQISVDEAKMSPSEFRTFENKFPRDTRKLKKLKRIYNVGGSIFLNCGTIPPLREKAWKYLFNWNAPSHFSKNFSESETNIIDWFQEPDPEIRLKYEAGQVAAISLLDPAGERFEIPINRNQSK
jgi:hypothetical protein